MKIPEFTPEELANETWRSVHEHYDVSSLGRVRYVNVLAGSYAGCPYHRISFGSGVHGRNPQSKMTHTLVAEAFLGPRPDGLVINHKDLNKWNNRVENLEYVTTGENIRHARRLRTWDINTDRHIPKGSESPLAKVTEEQVKEMRDLYATGTSNKTLRKMFGISKSQVSKIVNGTSWKHVD